MGNYSSKVERNKIGNQGCEAFRAAVAGKEASLVEILSLSGNGIQEAGLQSLCEGLRKCPALVSLDLSFNDLGPGAVKALTQVVLQLQILSLRQTNLSAVQDLGALLQRRVPEVRLQRLDLSHN